MNKSIEYIKSLIGTSRLTSSIPEDGWDSALVYSPLDLITTVYPGFTGETITGEAELSNHKRVKTTVEYDPNADFEYVSTKQQRHDGTLFFTMHGALEVVNKVLRAGTCDARLKPEDFEACADKYSLHYVIGDIVISSEDGDFGTDEKPWMYTRETILLPIKMWFEPLAG